MTRHHNRPVVVQQQPPKIELSAIKEEFEFYKGMIDYLMNRGVTFANCIRIIAMMQLGQSFPQSLLDTFTEEGKKCQDES